jgi:hypothetical protein
MISIRGFKPNGRLGKLWNDSPVLAHDGARLLLEAGLSAGCKVHSVGFQTRMLGSSVEQIVKDQVVERQHRVLLGRDSARQVVRILDE